MEKIGVGSQGSHWVVVLKKKNKELIHNIYNFDEKVIKNFISQKDRRLDFVYTKLLFV